jgi:hypothetical protein
MTRLRDFYNHVPNAEKDRASVKQRLDAELPDLKRLRELRAQQKERINHLSSVERESDSDEVAEILRAHVQAYQDEIERLERTGRFP